MTKDAAKAGAQSAANQIRVPILLYFSPIERSDFEPEVESWGYAPVAAVKKGLAGRWRETAKDEIITPA